MNRRPFDKLRMNERSKTRRKRNTLAHSPRSRRSSASSSATRDSADWARDSAASGAALGFKPGAMLLFRVQQPSSRQPGPRIEARHLPTTNSRFKTSLRPHIPPVALPVHLNAPVLTIHKALAHQRLTVELPACRVRIASIPSLPVRRTGPASCRCQRLPYSWSLSPERSPAALPTSHSR